MTVMTSMPPAPKALLSQADAFDLPSILIGVVGVGILTAGVLAAIFGVIPFSQDKGAQQDLSAINTAEGVSKARNGAFTDKAGLAAAGLTSGLPAGVAVTPENGGTGYCATSTSSSGKTFAIASEQTTPWQGDCTFTKKWTKRTPSAATTGWANVAVSSDGRHLLAHIVA